MLRKYLKDVWQRFKAKKVMVKILIILFIAAEIFLMVISFGKMNYRIETPGSLIPAGKPVKFSGDNGEENIYTVNIFEYHRPSVIQYWLAGRSKDMECIEIKEDDPSESESVNKGIASKNAAIRKALIIAYEKAKEVCPEINLEWELATDWILNTETADPGFEIVYDEKEIGGSGGAMMTLSFYRSLLRLKGKDDIAAGIKIAGTGTINVIVDGAIKGRIGKIGGVKQKVIAARLAGADIFYVDDEDYDDACKEAENQGCGFEVVKAVYFEDILKDLKKRKEPK